MSMGSLQTSSIDKETQFRVLIVDDDATILGLLKDLVSMVPGVHVSTASKAEEAMKIALAESIDVVFTDVHMPGVTGLEMIKDFIRLQKMPEVIVMTAFPSGEIAAQAMELGASSLLAKPFEDISLVEMELDKAIKKIIRQRSASVGLEKKKSELAASATEMDNDPIMKVSLGEDFEQIKSAVEASQQALDPSSPHQDMPVGQTPSTVSIRKIYDQSLLSPLVEVEVQRCHRTKRQFAFGLVEIPQNVQIKEAEAQLTYRHERMQALQACFRNSDVLFDFDGESIAVLGFECNKTGAGVLEFKLKQAGFDYAGFAVYPADATDEKTLVEIARRNLLEKRKCRLLIIEPEEFFGRIVRNMLSDPRYMVSWAKDYEEAYKEIQANSEKIKVGILSLSQDPKQWQLLSNLKKEGLICFPLVLFTEVALPENLKTQLQQLGVRAIIRKGASHEDFLYVVQSFVMQSYNLVARKNPRALVAVPLIYKAENVEISSNSFTLSREGVFIRELNPMPRGTKLELELFIPEGQSSIRVIGEVLYSVPYFVGVNRIHVPGMAIKFTSIHPDDQKRIDFFVGRSLTSYLLETE
jgi:DNA-binding response OmpR family regulator